MRYVVGIDPGPESSAWVGLDLEENRLDYGYDDNEALRGEWVDLRSYVFGLPFESLVAIETVEARGMPLSQATVDTAVWVGRFIEVCRSCSRAVEARGVELVQPREIRLELCGDTRAKWTNVRTVVLDRFGGEEVAIGGKRCSNCNGKGWKGRGRPPCEQCEGSGEETPHGPLWRLWDQTVAAERKHILQALAVALAAADIYNRREQA